MKVGRTLGVGIFLVVTAAVGGAASQPSPTWRRPFQPQPFVPVPTSSSTPTPTRTSGFEALLLDPSPGLASSDAAERLRAIRRIEANGDFRSLQLLLRQVERAERAFASVPLRLAVTRACAPFASRDVVQKLLASWLGVKARKNDTEDDLVVRAHAAMALAASGDDNALELLLRMVSEGGASKSLAEEAILAHPPSSLRVFLTPQSLKSAATVALLGRLGDLRASEALRRVLAKGDIALRGEAGISLARLGDTKGAELAKTWLRRGALTKAQRLQAAWILLLCRDRLAPRVVATILADPSTRDIGLTMAEKAPTAQLTPTLAGLLPILEREQRDRAVMALARSGGDLAHSTLLALLRKEPASTPIAQAFAACRSEKVDATLRELMTSSNRVEQKLGLRLAMARSIEEGRVVDGLSDVGRSLLPSKDPALQSLGAFATTLADGSVDEELLDQGTSSQVAGACRAALAMPIEERRKCALRLQFPQDISRREALAAGLHPQLDTPRLTQANLFRLAEVTSPSRPGFVALLGRRASDDVRDRLAYFLSSGDPMSQTQAALGLGWSTEPWAATLLGEALRSEMNPLVRRALTRALGRHSGSFGQSVLRFASRYDPDVEVRSLATLGLRGVDTTVLPQGIRALWIHVDQPERPLSPTVFGVSILTSSGWVVSTPLDADGVVVVPVVSTRDALVLPHEIPSEKALAP